MFFNRKNLEDHDLRHFYKKLLFPRLVEERMLTLLRQGKIGKWFSGIGQEAIAVGSTLALEDDEYILPMHRNLGVFTTRGIPLSRLAGQWVGKDSGFTKGRDRSFHFGSQEHKIIGMISHLGPQLAVADGIALAHKLKKENKVTLVYTGEGATSEGDFHEALNLASVWELPVIFLVENNGYGLSTPVSEQYRCANLVDRAVGYGMEGILIDGNNILEVYNAIDTIAQSIRQKPRPVLVECKTFRMRGHEEASGVKYVPPHLFDQWSALDPLLNFEKFLLKAQIFSDIEIQQIKTEQKAIVEQEISSAFIETEIQADIQRELNDVYASSVYTSKNNGPSKENSKRYIDTISDALNLAMERNDNLILMGQDIAEYGGAFKITDGFVAKFGKERIRNTPICESAIVGAALGLSINGYKSVVEMQFADFVSCGFNQIINNLAKTHYRWGEKADTVIRMPTGAGTGAGPFHSQSNEAWFTKTPGLKVVYPAFPDDAKGLLLAAIDDPNPVLYFEHKYLYRSLTGNCPEDYFHTEIGKARLVHEGDQCSIITYGLGVHWAIEFQEQHPEYSIDILDLRSLQPWDKQAVETTVEKTGRIVILHEDTLTCGFGAELSAYIAEHCFEYLDAPVMRCASLDTPIPMNKLLEDQFLAKARLGSTITKLLAY
ncbi:dehydrogenase [Pedobacter sp. HMF7647]|uniref:Dehydrogenase n=1 Tax=Hufsiella arboris TaxID=2695275 RepID=A0A7K1YB06_9SPHI|nr:dehydrogenase E1 component subunit alpha/beta [Hufsiella arboris]MXV51763.1 dehydrogenase [Hufsiella arboris]